MTSAQIEKKQKDNMTNSKCQNTAMVTYKMK